MLDLAVKLENKYGTVSAILIMAGAVMTCMIILAFMTKLSLNIVNGLVGMLFGGWTL